ncbi:MAG: DUF308 domain-containing protein [Candidatus Lokiarchaeota archaeon]|nr:DUF308 domain-containing protein [Candidatus Lokiarchaeota archaeon]
MENESLLKNINIIVGLIIIVLSIITLFYGVITLITLIILISIAFLFAGIGRAYNAITNDSLTKASKFMKYFSGLLSIIISIAAIFIALFNPGLAILMFSNLFGYLLIFIGVARISVGYLMESYTTLYRTVLILVGIITFIFSFIILMFPIFGYFVIVMLISASLLLNGITRLSFGLALKRIKSKN